MLGYVEASVSDSTGVESNCANNHVNIASDFTNSTLSGSKNPTIGQDWTRTEVEVVERS